jgi:hypothetical protein
VNKQHAEHMEKSLDHFFIVVDTGENDVPISNDKIPANGIYSQKTIRPCVRTNNEFASGALYIIPSSLHDYTSQHRSNTTSRKRNNLCRDASVALPLCRLGVSSRKNKSLFMEFEMFIAYVLLAALCCAAVYSTIMTVRLYRYYHH